MKEKEIKKQALLTRLAMILEDLENPCLEDQTTILLNELGKVRRKLAALEK